MSNLFSTVNNYSGRQPDNVQNIKQFVTTINSQVAWIYKTLTFGAVPLITPSDQTKDVLIPNNLYVNGSLFNPSDERLKTNVSILSNTRNDDLLNLKPVEFEYIKDANKTKHFGIMAQNVEEFFPELVSSNELGYKTVNYLELLPIVLSKMRSMQEEINELKKNNKNNSDV